MSEYEKKDELFKAFIKYYFQGELNNIDYYRDEIKELRPNKSLDEKIYVQIEEIINYGNKELWRYEYTGMV